MRGSLFLALAVAVASLVANGCSMPAEPSRGAGGTVSAVPDEPAAIAVGAVLPPLAFEGVDAAGAPASLRLWDYHLDEKAPPSLLVVRVSGGRWCGTCLWHAHHTSELARLGDGARVVDLVVGDRDASPALPSEALEWRRELDVPDGVAIGVDPSFTFGALSDGHDLVLPLFVLVDARSMRIVDALANPDPATLEARVAELLGRAPPSADDLLVDGLFHRNEWELLQTITVPGAPPPDPTNAVADDANARELGRALFFDAGLSPSGKVSCATCHDPSKNLSDGLPRGLGVAEGDRLTPSISLSAHARWQFWDGRADSLWAQALGPIESPSELGSSRLGVLRRVVETHAEAYLKAFPGHALPLTGALPAEGKPGDAAFDGLSSGDRESVTRVLVDVGKAIAAYERSFRVAPNALDAYLAGDRAALDADEKLGLSIFVRSGCMQCHWGPRLTDDAFHDTRTPTGRRDGLADRGRLDGMNAWLTSEFRATGRWSDSPGGAPLAADPAPSSALLGRFKTPALRGVGGASHFGHGGTFDVLASITEGYGRGGIPSSDGSSAGARDPWLPTFGETAQWGLVPFLRSLTATPIVP